MPDLTVPERPICTSEVTIVTVDAGEHLKCELPAGHAGQHRDGTTTWQLATVQLGGDHA